MKLPELSSRLSESFRYGAITAFTMLSEFSTNESMEKDNDQTIVAHLIADLEEYCITVGIDFNKTLEQANDYVNEDKSSK